MVALLACGTSRRCAAIGAFFWVIADPSSALAGNQDSYFFGDQAAVAGGAVVAITHDAGAAYYNPAGLGENDRMRLDVSASAYVLRLRGMDQIVRFRTSMGETGQGLDGTAMMAVPTSLVYVRALSPGLSAGLGLYVTDQDQFKMTADVPSGTDTQVDRVSFERKTVCYHFGPALGLAVSPRLRLGASLLGSYDRLDQRVDSALFVPSANQEFLSRLSDLSTTRVGIEPTMGLQYDVNSSVRVGVALRGPRLLLYGTRRQIVSALRPGVSPTTIDVRQSDAETRDTVRVVVPPRAVGGIAFDGDRGWIGLEADVAPGLGASDPDPRRLAVWNMRAGGLLKLSPKWRAGAGFFTDRSYADTPRAFPDYRVSYYGATLGIQTRHSVTVANDQDDPEEEQFRRKIGHADSAPALYFGTTLALRYAIGIGEAATLDLDTTGTTFGGSERRNVLWHEFAVHLGTGLYF